MHKIEYCIHIITILFYYFTVELVIGKQEWYGCRQAGTKLQLANSVRYSHAAPQGGVQVNSGQRGGSRGD